MPAITSRATVIIPLALLLGLATVISGAAEQHDARSAANTRNSQLEEPRTQPKWQLCLVGSRNCVDVAGHPAQICLLAPHQCDGDAGRLERLELAH